MKIPLVYVINNFRAISIHFFPRLVKLLSQYGIQSLNSFQH
jgi:hypothetical protein